MDSRRVILDHILDITTRSWPAFGLTFATIVAYAVWNSVSKHAFDPYPFVFLMGIITVLSYLQNIIIMTVQKEADIMQKKQAKYILNLMETVRAQVEVIKLTMDQKSSDK